MVVADSGRQMSNVQKHRFGFGSGRLDFRDSIFGITWIATGDHLDPWTCGRWDHFGIWEHWVKIGVFFEFGGGSLDFGIGDQMITFKKQ